MNQQPHASLAYANKISPHIYRNANNPLLTTFSLIAASISPKPFRVFRQRRIFTKGSTTSNTAKCDHHFTHILQLRMSTPNRNERTTLSIATLPTELNHPHRSAAIILSSTYKRYMRTILHDARTCLNLRSGVPALKIPTNLQNAQSFSP